jgi:hypothetical protein
MLDFQTLSTLLSHHPAWRLLRADHAPLIVSFLNRTFVVPNERIIAAADLAEKLEDQLYALRQTLGEDAFSKKSGLEYLNDWASSEKAFLRKFYRPESDEPCFELTPATEKVIAWLSTLSDRGFVGTESRLLTLFDLLRQIATGSEIDPAKRVAELHKRRDEIDAEIAQVQAQALAGDISTMDTTAIKERYQQFTQIARELLADFREVEQNFRVLDRRVRERIALWDGSKGALLEEIMGERASIAESDQGKSFRAFWDFLMSSQRQEELSTLLIQVLSLPAVVELKPDSRAKRVHYEWLEAGEHTQRTVAQLSQQLRRFLDDKAWLENRRIMDILRNIESNALALRDQANMGHATGLNSATLVSIDETSALIELPFERPLHTPTLKPIFANIQLDNEEEQIDASSLFSQRVVDKARLLANIRQALQMQSQVTLRDIIDTYPLEEGLAELITYLQIGSEMLNTVVNEDIQELILWDNTVANGAVVLKKARLPQMIFLR